MSRDDVRDRRAVHRHQGPVLHRRLPGRLHPHRRAHARDRPRGVHRLRRVRARVPGRGDLPRGRAAGEVGAVREDQRCRSTRASTRSNVLVDEYATRTTSSSRPPGRRRAWPGLRGDTTLLCGWWSQSWRRSVSPSSRRPPRVRTPRRSRTRPTCLDEPGARERARALPLEDRDAHREEGRDRPLRGRDRLAQARDGARRRPERRARLRRGRHQQADRRDSSLRTSPSSRAKPCACR